MKIVSGKEHEYADYVRMNSSDSYSKGVIDHAERWAALMENKLEMLAHGENLSASVTRFLVDNAEQLSQDADTEGMGFMYGCSVQLLANDCSVQLLVNFWIHGEELRRWHNLKVQIRNEGEQANES